MRVLAVVAVVAIAAVLAGSAYLFRSTQLTAYALCQVLYTRIAAADVGLGAPKSSSYDYFKQHPKALKAAHRENADTLASLPCAAP